jgi:DNA-directed RNA polymerase specialized sigma24 family protein
MSSPSDTVMALYDAFAPRLYALALRITGDEGAAAEILQEVFTAEVVPSEPRELVRMTREKALARYDRSGAATVESPEVEPAPRQLVEDVFFGGMSIPELARLYSMSEDAVRSMLLAGMAELRAGVARQNR